MPAKAARIISSLSSRCSAGCRSASCATSAPAVNSRESPGRIGNSRPTSTKITAMMPISAQVPKVSIRCCGSRKSVTAARTGPAVRPRAARSSSACAQPTGRAVRRPGPRCEGLCAPRRGATRAARGRRSAARGRRRPVAGGPRRGRRRRRALRPRAPRARRPPQRRRPVPLLDARGDRRRPGHAPAPVPRRDRELAARPEHRLGRPHGQRVPGGARCTSSATAAGTGAARWSPTATSTCATTRRSPTCWPGPTSAGCRCSASTTCPARCRSRATRCRARACSLFGQESVGLSDEARAAAVDVLHIAQFGSTRSINAGAAAAIAMHAWIARHAAP